MFEQDIDHTAQARSKTYPASIGGWFSDDDEVNQTPEILTNTASLGAKSYKEVGTSSDDESDEFVTTCGPSEMDMNLLVDTVP